MPPASVVLPLKLRAPPDLLCQPSSSQVGAKGLTPRVTFYLSFFVLFIQSFINFMNSFANLTSSLSYSFLYLSSPPSGRRAGGHLCGPYTLPAAAVSASRVEGGEMEAAGGWSLLFLLIWVCCSAEEGGLEYPNLGRVGQQPLHSLKGKNNPLPTHPLCPPTEVY